MPQPDQHGESLCQDSVSIAVNLEEGIEIQMRYSRCPIKLSLESLFPLKFSNANRGAGTTRFAATSMAEAGQSSERCRIGLGTLPFDGLFLRSPQALHRVFFSPAPDLLYHTVKN
jgi:hypothetical protein